MELDAQIRSSLSLAKADTRRCLQLMDDMLAVNIDPLMLKKHPNIVETVKKVIIKLCAHGLDDYIFNHFQDVGNHIGNVFT